MDPTSDSSKNQKIIKLVVQKSILVAENYLKKKSSRPSYKLQIEKSKAEFVLSPNYLIRETHVFGLLAYLLPDESEISTGISVRETLFPVCTICYSDAIIFAKIRDYCRICIKRQFEMALKEPDYPPKYHTLEESICFLGDELIQQYLEKDREYKSLPKDRVYCSSKSCLQFIASTSPDLSIVTCTKCNQSTCVKCLLSAHPNQETCPPPPKGEVKDSKLFEKFCEEKSCQPCPYCGLETMKKDGCGKSIHSSSQIPISTVSRIETLFPEKRNAFFHLETISAPPQTFKLDRLTPPDLTAHMKCVSFSRYDF